MTDHVNTPQVHARERVHLPSLKETSRLIPPMPPPLPRRLAQPPFEGYRVTVSISPAIIHFVYQFAKLEEVARLEAFEAHAEPRRGAYALILRATLEQRNTSLQLVDIGGHVEGVGSFESFIHRRGAKAVEFHLPLSQSQVEAIDANRTGAPRDVILQVQFHASVIGPRGVRRVPVPGVWRIPESDWLRLLIEAGYGDSVSFGFVVPTQVPMELETAAASYRDALGHWRRRDWKAAAAAGRSALEAMSKLPGTVPPPPGAEWGTGAKANWSADQRAALVRQGLIHLGHVAAHPNPDEITQDQAELVVSQAMLMLRARMRAPRL